MFTATFENVSNPTNSSNPKIGDAFKLTILTDKPNTNIYSDGGKVGDTPANKFLHGQTGTNGALVLRGVMREAQVGQWQQYFYTEVNGVKEGQQINFVVTNADGTATIVNTNNAPPTTESGGVTSLLGQIPVFQILTLVAAVGLGWWIARKD